MLNNTLTSMRKRQNIIFKKIPFPEGSEPNIKQIYHVVENGRSVFLDAFNLLVSKDKDLVKTLLHKMATHPNFKSGKIKFNLNLILSKK